MGVPPDRSAEEQSLKAPRGRVEAAPGRSPLPVWHPGPLHPGEVSAEGEGQARAVSMLLRHDSVGEVTQAHTADMQLRNDSVSEEARAHTADMLLHRGLGGSTGTAQPPARVATRTYVEICRRSAQELVRAGQTEEEVRVHYQRALRAQGLQDKHSAQRVRAVVQSVRGSVDIAQYVTREAVSRDTSPPLPRGCPATLWSNEANKVIGWFSRARRVQANSTVLSILAELRVCGVDTARWVAMRWRDSHGASEGVRRFEIMCESRKDARDIRDELNRKASNALAMTFVLGREHSVRDLDRQYVQHHRSQSPPTSPVQAERAPLVSQRSPSPLGVENYFAILSDHIEEDMAAPETEQAAPQPLSSHRVLDVMVWNACGFRRRVNSYLRSVIEGVDVFGVCETMCDQVNLTRLEGYHHHGISTERRVLGGAMTSRGVSVYWRTDLQVRVTPVSHEEQDPDIVWICLQPRQTTPVYLGCFYAPQHNSPHATAAYKRVEEQVAGYSASGEVVLMGDFNARTGLAERNHDSIANSSGPRLCGLVERQRLEFLDLPLGVPPFTRIQNDAKSVIDYILVSRSLAGERTKRVVVSECMDSDHSVVRATIGVPARRSQHIRRVEVRPAFEVLRDGRRGNASRGSARQVRDTFAENVATALSPWKAKWDAVVGAPVPPTADQLEAAATELTGTLRRVSEEVLGVVRIRRGKSHSWWNGNLTLMCQRRKAAYQRLLLGSGNSRQLWREYLTIRKEVKRAIEAARNDGWANLMKRIVEAKRLPSQKRMWDLIRMISKRAPMGADPLFIRGDEGDLTTSPAEAVEEWRKHFERVANPQDQPQYDRVHMEGITLEEEVAAQGALRDPVLEVTVEEINKALRKIPAGSAPGPDGVGNIVLKYGGGHQRTPFEPQRSPEEEEQAKERQDRFASFLHTMFSLCLRAHRVPTSWKNALQVPIPKRSAEEDPAHRGNFRGITMQSATGKLFCRTIHDAFLSEPYEAAMCHEQGGFRSGRRCAQQHFLLADTIHRTLTGGAGLYVVFIDIQKAYPSVWRDGLFYKLRRTAPHLNDRLIALLKDCITDGETRVLLQGVLSSPYASHVGVREGAVESPTLFNFFINDLEKDLRDGGCAGAAISGGLKGAMFADDIVLVSDSQADMQRCLDVLHRFCCRWRLSVSMPKTKLMRVGNTAEYDNAAPLHIGDSLVERVDKYQYLGLWFTENGGWEAEFQERMKKVNEVWARNRHFFADTHIPIRARWLVWCATIRSRLEYGCEVFIANDAQMKEMEDLQLHAARLILGCNRHTSLDAVYGDLKCQPLGVRFAKYRLRLYHEVAIGHALPLHRQVWDANLEAVSRLPPHSFRRVVRSLRTKYIDGHSVDFEEEDGWEWAKRRVDAVWVGEWRCSMQEKVDKAEEHGSIAQVAQYQQVKGWWGDVAYTNLPDCRFSRLLFKVRSGTLPVLAFEGKRESPLPLQCVCCNQEAEETIQHFLWECDGAAANIPAVMARTRMLQALRGIVASVQAIVERYGQEATSDRVLQQLALGAPVEMVFEDAFSWRTTGGEPLPREMKRTLTVESRIVANRLQGRVFQKVRDWLVLIWQQRCKHVDRVLQPPPAPHVAPVAVRGAQAQATPYHMCRSVEDLCTAVANTREPPSYVFFYGHRPKAFVDKSCFSQWFDASFEVDGVVYKTAEHYMMAEKARLFGDHETLQRILESNTPAEAKDLGRQVSNWDEAVWEANCFAIVARGNYHKFTQNPLLRAFLLKTASAVLVEASPRDRIWGIGMGANTKGIENPDTWRGRNLLGFALMEARERIRSDDSDASRHE